MSDNVEGAQRERL